VSVPLFDTSTALAPLRDELRAAIERVLDSERYILGPEVRAFEQEFAAYCGAGHAVGVANGTEAITIALRAMGVGPGDEVLVPSFTFYASVEAIAPTGATPVFCDVDPQTFCINAETVAEALTPHTKVVIAVHLFGNLAPVAEIEALGVPVLEDAAQAAGSTVTHDHRTHGHATAGHSTDDRPTPSGPATGQFGHSHPTSARPTGAHSAHSHPIAHFRPGALGKAATFSFFPSKNLGCFGDGGMIVTDDERVADEARVLRFHGSRDKVSYELLGYNSRLDELQAAVLRVQLPHLDAWADGRRHAAGHYAAAGLGELVKLPRPTLGSAPAWHLYVVRHPEADRLAQELTQAGIGCRAYYRTPVHEQPATRAWKRNTKLPGTDEAAREHLAIPISPVLSDDQVEQVVAAVRSAV
jgi:dTDP-3-amino-3,4,6-trideoxy-alpha-D-glucose transaminase